MAPHVVVEGDPAHVLLAGADAAAEPELERQEHAVERAAVGGEHDAGADRAPPGCPASAAGAVARLPGDADLGEEVVARAVLPR